MTSVSQPAVSAAHHAKKHAKSSFSAKPAGDGGEFGGLFASMQAGMEGQDLAARTGKASPPVQGLASQILGPSVHIITSETPSMSDDSLYAFARSQGMDESALALIFQRAAPELPAAPPVTAEPATDPALLLQSGELSLADASAEALLLAQQRLALQQAAGTGAEPALKTEVATPATPYTDADGMSVLDLGAAGRMRWSVAESASAQLPADATKVAKAAQAAAQATAQAAEASATAAARQDSQDAPGTELAATLVMGDTESRQFAKRLESRQTSLRAERLGSITSDSFRTAFLGAEASRDTDAARPPEPVDSLALNIGSELTGEDLQMIWAHRQAAAERDGQSTQQATQAAERSDSDLRAEQYEKLTQRLGEALGQRLAAQIARGDWKVELALKPQDLGNIEIKLGMKDGALEASFTASEAMTRDLIADSLPRLRDTLAQSGMEVAQVNVNARQDSQNGGNPTPGRNKTPAGINGVSKGSLANTSLPADSVATRIPKAADDQGLDILV